MEAGGGSRNLGGNRKSTTKIGHPWQEDPGTAGSNGKSTTKSQSPPQAGKRIKESMGTWENGKSTTKSPSRKPNATLNQPSSTP